MSDVIPETGAATVTIERAGEILGIGRSTAYELLRRGEFPVRVVPIGRRRMVPTVLLERFLLGEEQAAG